MHTVRSTIRTPLRIGVLGGIVHAGLVLSWFFSRGLYFSPGDAETVITGVGYSMGGLVLMAAVPLYLLAGTTIWFLGNTVYQELYGAHLHPLSSYLTVWPLLLCMAVAAGLVEVLIRYATEREFGQGGFRQLV